MSEVREMTYVVTGATGFLGRHVIQRLVARRARVIAVVRDLSGWEQLDWPEPAMGIRVVECALDQVEALTVAINDALNVKERVDGLFHLAAYVDHARHNASAVFETNCEGTKRMVRLANALACRMMFVSTSGTVASFSDASDWADEHSPIREKPIRRWPYYHSKVRAEKEARDLASNLGVSLVVIRPPVMLGPGDHRFRSTKHVLKMLLGKLPFVIDGGIHFVDIRDAAEAMVAAMQLEYPKPVYHLDGTACGIREFFDMVAAVSGAKSPPLLLPYRLAHGIATGVDILREKLGFSLQGIPEPVVVEMASRHWGLKSRFSESELGYSTREPLQTLSDTVTWLRSNHPGLSANQN